MNSIQTEILVHFFSKYPATTAVSRYSPLASKLAAKCQLMYPAESGGVYRITADDIITMAKSNGLLVKVLPNGDAQIGVSAEHFNNHKKNAAFDESTVCRCGFAPIGFFLFGQPTKPVLKSCCTKCGELGTPGKPEIEHAKEHLLNIKKKAPTKLEQMNARVRGEEKDPPLGGAMIIAARELGFTVKVNLEGKFHITVKCAGGKL